MRSETCRGEGILYDFNVFFNKYVHELVTIDTENAGRRQREVFVMLADFNQN